MSMIITIAMGMGMGMGMGMAESRSIIPWRPVASHELICLRLFFQKQLPSTKELEIKKKIMLIVMA